LHAANLQHTNSSFMLMNNKLFVSFEYPAVQRDAIVVQQAQGIAKMAAEVLL